MGPIKGLKVQSLRLHMLYRTLKKKEKEKKKLDDMIKK